MNPNVILTGFAINAFIAMTIFAFTGKFSPNFVIPATVLLWIGLSIRSEK